MIGVYFSGTGNTKYCLEKFTALCDANAKITALEDACTPEKISHHQDIIFAYPIYYSNLPKIVRDFIVENSTIWKNKRIFIIVTMGLFSGDGAGVSARLFKKYGAHIWGGLHIKMPDCICDVKALKRAPERNRQLIDEAGKKIISAAENLKSGSPPQNGLGFFYHLAGLFGQRLWFFEKTQNYSDKIHIATDTCIGCGQCVAICTMNNLSLAQSKASAGQRCTLCYRCANQCPQKAITILGKQVISQHSVRDLL